MTPAGRDGSFLLPFAFGRLVSRRAALRRMVDGGYPPAWVLARLAVLDEDTERRLNTAERRRWFLRWWAGA